jgi:hypothetical protein
VLPIINYGSIYVPCTLTCSLSEIPSCTKKSATSFLLSPCNCMMAPYSSSTTMLALQLKVYINIQSNINKAFTYLLEMLQDLLQTKLRRNSLDGRQALSTVSLLTSNICENNCKPEVLLTYLYIGAPRPSSSSACIRRRP